MATTKTKFHTDITPGKKNFKWKVPIQECKQGHLHVPVKGKCLVCQLRKNNANFKDVR